MFSSSISLFFLGNLDRICVGFGFVCELFRAILVAERKSLHEVFGNDVNLYLFNLLLLFSPLKRESLRSQA